ncbi:hypothetical protein SAMN04488053_11072 [Alkalicoccus daliensis]|uniref:Uncharacterized protein n=1 Tax=Alkalicoccus daliensis TaxID=745820 RepID=A0A1H0IAU0_9BACI|nr:hypothetical protein SAMN04488053_11072 [Alkalicoccus daliensis]
MLVDHGLFIENNLISHDTICVPAGNSIWIGGDFNILSCGYYETEAPAIIKGKVELQNTAEFITNSLHIDKELILKGESSLSVLKSA